MEPLHLLLAAYAGYWFQTHYHPLRFYAMRASGYHIVSRSAIWGLFLFLPSYGLALLTSRAVVRWFDAAIQNLDLPLDETLQESFTTGIGQDSKKEIGGQGLWLSLPRLVSWWQSAIVPPLLHAWRRLLGGQTSGRAGADLGEGQSAAPTREDLEITIPIAEVVSIRMFNIDLYNERFAPNGSEREKLE